MSKNWDSIVVELVLVALKMCRQVDTSVALPKHKVSSAEKSLGLLSEASFSSKEVS